jgi:prepilin-type N-terminal cleavage/methylation domain-containing protein
MNGKTKNKTNTNTGVTIIELVVSLAILSVLIVVSSRIFTPVMHNLKKDNNDHQNYKQLIFASLYLDSLYRMSESVEIASGNENSATTSNSSGVEARGGTSNKIIFNLKNKKVICEITRSTNTLDCFGRPIISIETFGTTTLQFTLDDAGFGKLQISKWQIIFGQYPNVYLN